MEPTRLTAGAEQVSTVFDRLHDEITALDTTLSALDASDWSTPSACDGWDVTTVVAHLWVSEEQAAAVLAGDAPGGWGDPDADESFDAVIDRAARRRAEAGPAAVRAGWRDTAREVADGLAALPPDERVTWTTGPMAPRSLATTRIMETWAHGHDIRAPLGLEQPDTPGLRDVCWLGWRTLGFAFRQAGEELDRPVRVELSAPDGRRWTFGPGDAGSRITGDARQWALRATRRLPAGRADALAASDGLARRALRLAATFLVDG